MKKLLSLLLALTMLILPCAFAENAEDAENTEATEEIEVQLVEDAIAGLRYNLPADWIVLSAAAIESMLAASMETEEVESALSDELIAQVEGLTQSGISVSMSADMLANLNIWVRPASGMTTQMLYDSRDMFLESYKAQESQGLTLENEGLLVTFGERDFMSISCTVLEQSMDVYMFVENDMMYTITFINATPEVEEVMLSSIEVMPVEDSADEAEDTTAEAEDTTAEAEDATVETEESAAPEE